MSNIVSGRQIRAARKP